jgi:hypothetical protein
MAALYHLMALAINQQAAPQARAIAERKIDELRQYLARAAEATDPNQRAHSTFALAQIKRFQENPKELNLPRPAEPPPGQPIGDLACDYDDGWSIGIVQ